MVPVVWAVLGQAGVASARGRAPTSLAPRMAGTKTVVILVPPLLRRYWTGRWSSRCMVKRRFFSTLIGCCSDHSKARLQQRRPGRIGRIARRFQQLLVAAGDVHSIERRSGISAGVAEEHDHASVRGPGRPLVVIALGQNPLAGAVRPPHTAAEPPLPLLRQSYLFPT